MTDQHPITQLEELTRVIKTRRLSNLDLDQITIAVHLLNNLLVRIDLEKAPSIKAAVEPKFEIGQRVEIMVSNAHGQHWQVTTVIDKKVLEVHPPVYQYQTAVTGRGYWIQATRIREPMPS